MNAHVSQSLQTHEELLQLAAVPTQIISPREAKPIISVVQDIVLGLYRITKPNVQLTEKQFFNLMVTNPKGIRPLPQPIHSSGSIQRWSGRQILSSIIPEKINVDMKSNQYNENKTKEANANHVIKITNGQIKSGTFDKDVYQARTKGLVHSIFNEYGPDETRIFLDNTQKLICNWLVLNGFSVGISDMVVDESSMEGFQKIIHDMKVKVYDVIGKIHMGKYENKSTKSTSMYFEREVNDMLNEAIKKVGDSGTQQVDENVNRLINMIKSKSKGSTVNVSQMIGCLGQQNVDGKRIPYGFDYRTLPHYTKYDDGPESRGFVESSFIRGLTPQEFFFHAMGGREGLIDTAVQTSETGYLQRKLVKAMEDCKVYYDGSVRNASGSIIQFLYGDDGMDATKIESQQIPYVEYDHDEFVTRYNFSDANYKTDLKHIMTDEAYKGMNQKELPNLKKRMEGHIKQLTEDREFIIVKLFKGKTENSVMCPVSFFRIINIAKGTLHNVMGGQIQSDLSPSYVLDTIEELCKELFVNKAHRGNHLFQMLIRAYLSPKIVIMHHNLNQIAFDYVVNQVRDRYVESLAHPSEMVGIISAQSIGEPSTQLTLNSVHYDTDLLLKIDGQVKKLKIGDFVEDNITVLPKEDIESHPNDTTLAWLKNSYVEILSCDKAGQITWKQVEAVTKHPVVNEDGTNTLLKVYLKSGRSVIATKAKSFLKRVNNEIIQVHGKDLNVGDRLPVSTVLPVKKEEELNFLDVSKYLSKKEFIFMSEVEKALAVVRERKVHNSPWYKKNNGTVFTLPYGRSDAFMDSGLVNGKKGQKQMYEPNCVYPLHCALVTAKIPEMIPLDEEFGFFVGAFLAEGHATTQHVHIANNDVQFRQKILDFAKRYDIGTHVTRVEKNNGVSTEVHLHTTVLAPLMRTHFGELSHFKKIPAELLFANEQFLKALLSGYISGDGHVKKAGGSVSAHSVSRPLLDGIQQILTRFGIISKIVVRPKSKKEFKKEVQQPYEIQIGYSNATKFAQLIKMGIEAKQVACDRILSSYRPKYINSKTDIIPDVVLQSGTHTIHRDTIKDLIKSSKNKEDIDVLNNILKEQIEYDEIVKIEEIANTCSHVYDLTVAETRNFNTYNGLAVADTFHLSGVASASKTVRGVPRLKELLGVSKKMKTPSMKIHFTEKYRHDKKACLNLMNDIRTVRFKDIVVSSKIYFDPKDLLMQDNEFINIKKKLDDCDTTQATLTPWVIRMQFNKESMIQYHIDTIQLHQKLLEFYRDVVSCYFTDDNTDSDVVFRIKMTMGQSDADDMLTELKALEHNILENIIIKGTENIEGVSIVKVEKRDAENKLVKENKTSDYNPLTQKFVMEDEWCVVTDGTNFIDVLAAPNVDSSRTITNNIVEVYETLGIEAVRQSLFIEIGEVLDGVHVDYRHIAMLVDVQTNKGYILSIDRHGINRGDIGPLAKCSFEETTDKLIKAGVFAEVDKINGVSANIMLGQIAPAGTGDCEILMDHEMINYYQQYNKPNISRDEEESQEYTPCDIDNFKINYHLPKYSASLNKETPQLLKRIKNI